MAKQSHPSIPADYQPLKGSERRPSPTAKLLGPADPHEVFSVTIVLRRRPDGPPAPDFSYFANTPPSQRRRMSSDEFAAKYGASADDLKKVTDFATAQGLKVVETHASRRTVVVSGSVADMSKAFAVELRRYEHDVTPRRGTNSQKETYRGRDGAIHVPKDLADIIVGVFGLDNRRITKRNSGDPPNTNTVSFATIRSLYNFPSNSVSGQTIAILSEDGYG